MEFGCVSERLSGSGAVLKEHLIHAEIGIVDPECIQRLLIILDHSLFQQPCLVEQIASFGNGQIVDYSQRSSCEDGALHIASYIVLGRASNRCMSPASSAQKKYR